MNRALIVAFDEEFVIGRDGALPWRLSADLRRFKRITMGHCLIMGRRTYESIGRPLPGRTTIVITTHPELAAPGCRIAPNIEDALAMAREFGDAFFVGGARVYRDAVPLVDRLFVTRVHTRVLDGDTFFPSVDWSQWRLVESDRHAADERNEFDYTFEVFQRASSSEGISADPSGTGKDS